MIQSKQIAAALSYLLSPISMALYSLLIIGLFPPIPNEITPWYYFIIAFFFLCIFPMVAIVYNHRRGTVDIWVSNKDQRTPFYLIAIIGYILSILVFYIQQDLILFVFSLSYLCVTLALTITNLITKISSHSAGIAGPVTALGFMYGIYGAALYLFLVPVIWARLKMNAHTIFQLIFGIILSMIVTALVYLLFYPSIPSFF